MNCDKCQDRGGEWEPDDPKNPFPIYRFCDCEAGKKGLEWMHNTLLRSFQAAICGVVGEKLNRKYFETQLTPTRT